MLLGLPIPLQPRISSAVAIKAAKVLPCPTPHAHSDVGQSKRTLFPGHRPSPVTRHALVAARRQPSTLQQTAKSRRGALVPAAQPEPSPARLPSSADNLQILQRRREELDDLCTRCKSFKFPSCPEVGPMEVWEKVCNGGVSNADGNLVIVDARREEEHKVSMLPGSITQRDFEARKDAYSDSIIYCYCTVGFRSGSYADKLRREGLQAYNLRGSIAAWTQEGLPLVKREDDGTETETKQVLCLVRPTLQCSTALADYMDLK
mmetsp:Transcript_42171/g.75695  ORF Transcript_42171/g.75695 Transcript_42171/m.75695 type:complete len:262 (-) Transcript_42171:108-893(-)